MRGVADFCDITEKGKLSKHKQIGNRIENLFRLRSPHNSTSNSHLLMYFCLKIISCFSDSSITYIPLIPKFTYSFLSRVGRLISYNKTKSPKMSFLGMSSGSIMIFTWWNGPTCNENNKCVPLYIQDHQYPCIIHDICMLRILYCIFPSHLFTNNYPFFWNNRTSYS